MADVLALDLVDKNLVTDQIVISIGYDKDNLENTEIKNNYQGEVVMDYLGRKIPKGSHGSINLPFFCSSSKIILEYTTYLFDHIVNQNLLVRRLNICANHIKKESDVHQGHYQQLNLFFDVNKIEEQNKKMQNELKNENKLQKTIIDIQKKYGKNSVLKGMNYQDKATTKERNKQIGGHKA
jgi:DNA polymerase V